MIDKFFKLSFSIFLILLPIFFLPVTTDFFEYNKLALLVVFTLLILFLSSAKFIQGKKIALFITPFDIPILGILIITTLSTIFAADYKVGAILSPFGLVSVISITILYICIVHYRNTEKLLQNISYSIIISGIIFSGFTLFMYLTLPSHSSSPQESPLLSFLFLLIPLSISLTNIKKSKRLILAAALIIITETLLGSSLLSSGLNILSYSFSIPITASSLKSIHNLLLGVGPGNFLTAFTLFRPVSTNSTPYWNILFNSSSSFLLTLTTEIGLIGGLAFLMLPVILIIVKFKKNSLPASLLIPLVILFVIQIITIGSITIFIYTFILLALISPKKKLIEVNLETLGFLNVIFLIPVALFSIGVLILGSKVYWAELLFKKSLDAIPTNNGQLIYNLQKEAINQSKYVDRYHVAFSQTSLAIANSLSAKKDKTAEDNQNIPKLVQQSINEARIAVALYKTSVTDWNNLADIYTSLSQFANGSDNWAIAAYNELTVLYPTDPQTRLLEGGIYYKLGRFDEAQYAFKKTVSLKPDWANAHYNLAAAYIKKGEFKEAQTELNIVLSLLPRNSPDYQKALNDLKMVEKL